MKICVSQAPTTVRPFPEHLKKKKKFEDVTTKSMTCVQMAKMYSYFKSYTPSGRYLTDILNPLGKIHIKNRGKKSQRDTFRSLAAKVKKNPFEPWHVIKKPNLKE